MIQKAPANIASILEIEKDEPMYFIERLRYADNETHIKGCKYHPPDQRSDHGLYRTDSEFSKIPAYLHQKINRTAARYSLT